MRLPLLISVAILTVGASHGAIGATSYQGPRIQSDTGSLAYHRLARAISDIDTSLTYELRAGSFSVRNCGAQLLLDVQPQTRASFRLIARNGQLTSAKIEFSTPIGVSLPYARGISSLSYDFDRRALTINGATQVPLFLRDQVWHARCSSFLNLDGQLSQALLGRPWPALASSLENKDGNFQLRPVIIRTSLESPVDRGLPISFNAGAELGADNGPSDHRFRIQFVKAGRATLRSLLYAPDIGATAYDLSEFSCESIVGTIACTDARLNIAPQGTFSCRSITLSSDSFQVKGGTLECVLDRGSKFLLNRSGSVPSRIILDSRSSLYTPALTYLADDRDCTLTLGAGSSGTFRIFDGVLAITESSALRVDRGCFVASYFVGTWGDHEPVTFAAAVDQLDLAIAGGALELTKSMPPVLLTDGHIVGSGLRMSSHCLPSISGSLSEFRATLAGDSTFSMPVGLCFTLASDGSLTALDEVHLRTEPNPVKGEFVVDAAFSQLSNHEYATFTLTDGRLTMPFAIDDDGVMSSPSTMPIGDALTRISNATFTARESEGGVLILTVTVSRGKLLCDPRTRGFRFDALWSGEVKHLAFETANVVDSLRRGNSKAGLRIRNSSGIKCGFWDRPLAFNGTAVTSLVPLIIPCVVGDKELTAGNEGEHPNRHKASFDDLFHNVEFQAHLGYQAHSLMFEMRATTAGGPNIEADEPVIDSTLFCATVGLLNAAERPIGSMPEDSALMQLPRQIGRAQREDVNCVLGTTWCGDRITWSRSNGTVPTSVVNHNTGGLYAP